jgi:cystathionine gamma-synthase
MGVRSAHPSTAAVHAGEWEAKIGDSVATPIFQTATYAFRTSREVRAYHEAKIKTRYEYGRYGSPTQLALEKKLAEIFGSEDALVTSSGMSAIADVLLALLRSGDHLVMTSECYRRTRAFCEKVLVKYGVRITFANPDAASITAAITRRTKAVFVEIPTNPHLYVPDIPRIAAATRRKRIPLIVDPTIAGPFQCDPFALGADIVLLSLTKYLAGHNDVIGGGVLGSRAALGPIREVHGTAGTLLPPQSIYLILRGMKTVALRVERQNQNAQQIADYLERHPKTREVYYPGLASHPHHKVAVRIMKGFGCIVSFRMKGNLAKVERFLDNLRLFRIAPSLGGVESLIESVVTMSFWDKTKAERAKLGIPDDLVRVSAGIEDIDDLIGDLEQAFGRI